MEHQESARTDSDIKWTFPDTRYSLRQLLAVGGSSRVFAAEQRFLSRAVAIKIPNSGHTRSLDEIEALVRARGEGVVQLLDAGELRNRPYLVLELLEGRPLSGLLAARQRLSPLEVVKIAVEVARTLSRCHRAGVIHRNIKPANLFVTPSTRAQVTLIDFGAAWVNRSHNPPSERQDVVAGTPEYMAPEVARGEMATEQSDQYSLGVTLYECLTGMLPTVDVSAMQRLQIPASLRQVVTKLLAPEPGSRYGSMRELVDALRGCVDRDPASVDLLGRSYQTPAQEVPGRAYSRRFPRAPYSTLARAIRAGSQVDGRIEEISESGLQFLADTSVDNNETVMLRFALPISGAVVDVVGVARWNRTSGGRYAMGFELMEISDSARAEIKRYVSLLGGAGGTTPAA